MKEILEKYGTVLCDEDLSKHTTYKTGGKASFMVKPNSINDLVNLVSYLKKENIKYFILGNGSNVILPDGYFEGVVLKLDLLNNYEINEEEKTIYAESGVYLPKLSNILANNGYSCLEWAGGLPGTLGGSIYGNAGAYNVSMADILIEVTVFENNSVKILKKEKLTFGYRTSIFKNKKDCLILSAKLKLEVKPKVELIEVMKNRFERRIESQPLDFPSAGSVFRNPSIYDYPELKDIKNIKIDKNGKISAWFLIESCNLKGTKIGGAKVSEKHANFIVNDGNAKSSDIIKLIELVKAKVYEKYNVKLIQEQEIIEFY